MKATTTFHAVISALSSCAICVIAWRIRSDFKSHCVALPQRLRYDCVRLRRDRKAIAKIAKDLKIEDCNRSTQKRLAEATTVMTLHQHLQRLAAFSKRPRGAELAQKRTGRERRGAAKAKKIHEKATHNVTRRFQSDCVALTCNLSHCVAHPHDFKAIA
jgi:hypothetical protein